MPTGAPTPNLRGGCCIMKGTSIVVAAVLCLTAATSADPAAAGATVERLATKPAVPAHLLFTRTESGDVQTIYAASGRNERQLSVPGQYCCLVRVSPDHRRIL